MAEKTCICGTCYVIHEGKALLHRHKKLGVWLPPGGHVDENETPLDAAVRETLEETGFEVEVIPTQPLYGQRADMGDDQTKEMPQPLTVLLERVRYDTGVHMHFDIVYLARPKGARRPLPAGESGELMWVPKDEIDSLDTYPNIKKELNLAFEAHERLAKRTSVKRN